MNVGTSGKVGLRRLADEMPKARSLPDCTCGTMGAAVDETLAQLLGREALDRLLAEGRYRRDVY
mgnify:CR=1 FL=1